MTAVRVCATSDVPSPGAFRVEVPGPENLVDVAIVRDEAGGLHAIGDICSHAYVSLSEGEVEDCSIECWLHGSRFDLRTGEPSGLPAINPVPVYTLTVQGDDVLVDIDALVPSSAPSTSTSATSGKD